MVGFNNWCSAQNLTVGAHSLRVLSDRPTELANGRTAIAAAIPGHYASEEHIARNLARLGKPAAAEFVTQKLPTSKSIRSGDLGEILATEYISEQTPFMVPIRRLRWKDHRNMAMRGDDVIALQLDANSRRLRFLKAEAKSRATLPAGVVNEARAALDKDSGLPSAHALSFVSARLMDIGNTDLVDAIDAAQLKDGIPANSVTHLLFTFSGNDPTVHLQSSLQGYRGNISQIGVGLRVSTHADFVRAVYDLVIFNANNR
jgi:Cap4 SAVED domain